MPYTPPDGDDVNFVFQGDYTPPSGDGVDFYFGLVATIYLDGQSRDSISDDSGFNNSILRWYSDISGDYRVELGGAEAFAGLLLEEGFCPANYTMEYVLYDNVLTTWSGYSGAGSYSVNVYVKSSDNIWSR